MHAHRATIVTDLGFGDAGKGSVVDYLTATSKSTSTVVRHNGGGQAAHNVVTPDGRHHTFNQFGSGTFNNGVRTHLSRFMLVDPVLLFYEATLLEDLGCDAPCERLSVDEEALVVTPFHKAANKLREKLRGEDSHGTCGMGIGETMADSFNFSDSVKAKDFYDQESLERKLRSIQERKREEFKAHFAKYSQDPVLKDSIQMLNDSAYSQKFAEETILFAKKLKVVGGGYLKELSELGDLVFEGAQGVLLDEWYGFHPHTTWSTTTCTNAVTLLDEIDYTGITKKLGLTRAYATRHGRGPFVSMDENLTKTIPDYHNSSEGWQGEFRVGWFDSVMMRYALSVSGGVDELVVTNIDRIVPVDKRKMCTSYFYPKGIMTSFEESLLVGTSVDSDLFEGSFLKAYAIKKKNVLQDLSHQEALTGLLAKAIPSYVTVGGSIDEYLNTIENELGVPISILSYGPTRLNKFRK